MKIITATEMRELDRRVVSELGIPSLQLMENAGSRVAEWLSANFPRLHKLRVLILCGKGNNGGDGLVVARLLRQKGCTPVVYLFSRPLDMKSDAAENLKRWEAAGGRTVVMRSLTDWKEAQRELPQWDLVVDALIGTGLEGAISGVLSTVISDVNQFCQRATVIAVDTPSGLPAGLGSHVGEVMRADHTITFTAPKVGQLGLPISGTIGHLMVRSIGAPADLIESTSGSNLRWIEPGEFSRIPWRRRPDAHKGTFGHVLIVAGSIGKSGAAALSAIGALRAGAGLATVAIASEALPMIASTYPEVMTEPLICTDFGTVSTKNLEYGRFADLLRGKSALAIGPGLSTIEETQRFVRSAVVESSLPIILDADGLNAYAGRSHELQQIRSTKVTITPHPGEMARLLGCSVSAVQENRLQTALDVAARWNVFVILKGLHTVVATPDGRAFFNSTGNPRMATAGTGDVLTGILAGLTAQFGTENWESVLALGVYLHGLAGDLAAEKVSDAPIIASDLVRMLPQAFHLTFAEA